MNKASPALYFDLTDIVEYAINHSTVTGIQRSVLRILESIVRENAGRRVAAVVRHPLTGELVLADLSFMREAYYLGDLASRFGHPAGKNRLFAGKLRQYRARPLKWLFHAVKLELQWASSPKLRAQMLSQAQKAPPSCLTDEKPVPGSFIVTLGAGWVTNYDDLHRYARLHDCETVSFVHDLIPLSQSWFAKDKNGRFRAWLHHAASSNALLLCNSTATKGALEAYLSRSGLAANVARVRFPHEFKSALARDKQTVRDEISQVLQRDYVLCVGTIEIRKNVLALLQAWQELQSARGTQLPLLVLAGGRGRGADDVHAFLRRTQNVDGTVMVAAAPNDAELELLYQHCRFTVFPSLLEGWGLPIGESLWFGKPVLCAANSSMPEVGGGFATYFDHEGPGSLPAALGRMIDDPVPLPAGIQAHLTTWNDTAVSICAAIDAGGGNRRAERETRAPAQRWQMQRFSVAY